MLHTERLVLRPVEMRDIDFIQQYFADWSVVQFLRPPVPNPYPANGAWHFVSKDALPKMHHGTGITFIIELKDGTPIGGVGGALDDPSANIWHRGFWLAQPYRGQGRRYMKEASLAALRWIFENTEATEVLSENAPSNKASSNISASQEFEFCGTTTVDPPYHNGEDQQEQWRMTRKHFFSLHGR